MTDRSNKSLLANDARRQAIDFGRKKSYKTKKNKETFPAQSFNELEGSKEIKQIKAIGEALGVENPFFRCHDGIANADTRIAGQKYTNFGSYDYLGLNGDERVKQAAHSAIERYGISASASRLVAGERPCHRQLERAFADHYNVEDAMVFVSGHATNVTVIGKLMNEKDIILHDALAHNSIVVGAELSGANRRSFKHNDLDMLESLLNMNVASYQNVLVCVEGLYSMDGDLPDLPRLIELKKRFGFWLMVDEAHSLGTVGKTGAGVAEYFNIDPKDVDIWMGTLSKTLGSTGGYIAGSRTLIDFLKSYAPGFVFSVGLPPLLAEAALKSLEILKAEPERVTTLQKNCDYFLKQAKAQGLDTGLAEGHCVVPIIIGDSLRATRISGGLLQRGFNVLPIIFPAVPMNAARLRFFLTSEHSFEQIDQALLAVKEELGKQKGSGINSLDPAFFEKFLSLNT